MSSQKWQVGKVSGQQSAVSSQPQETEKDEENPPFPLCLQGLTTECFFCWLTTEN